MRKKLLTMPIVAALLAIVLSGCEPLMVLNPKGPNAETLSNTIILSIITMAVILLVVYLLLFFMLKNYRASKMGADYEPPHEAGNHKLEIIWTVIPILIVSFLSVVTIYTTDKVEKKPEGYGNKEALVIYASSSEWKWHFSYPEEGIETVNYAMIPTDRPIEFRLYSFGTIASFWVPQLAGQKYAMADMLTTIHLAADHEGDYWGRNSNFNGEGFADQEFTVTATKQKDFDSWVKDVKASEPALTEKEFDKLLKPSVVGRSSYSSTHLSFSPAPMDHKDMMKADKYTESKKGSKTSDQTEHDMDDMDEMDK
ncbi:cytochrome aa3 quinol oxidase subunit II [Kurthia sibirica]|uniref:Quinol oxidase subunit 2 n=1 Tax=Kurthia sibirica TaxID=202750 RepID=A0A2U3AJU3_9BACL|nr:cytochrome aa3 quinol oxidase subunit II [Kurthia sibirica]PWI24771.1 cytochrome aa3 quinol oxidase subunit II [Kurthia sibirica]GEK35624.1 quinol oxidase subunit 2 [Kurthia sibirica]